MRDRLDQRLAVGMKRLLPELAGSSPVSTIFPRYMTETRSATWRTIARSCEIRSSPSPSVARELDEQVRELRLRRGVERGERLVEHDHRRLGGERAGDRDPLALPARELVRETVDRAGRQPDELAAARAPGPARSEAGKSPSVVERIGELRADLAARVERRVRVLEDELEPGELARRGRAGRAASTGSPAKTTEPEVGFDEPDRGPGERRLAAARTRRRGRRSARRRR